MTAVIYVDLDSVHPVVDGEWHRARFQNMPQSGESVTMLCGLVASAEYERSDNRRRDAPPTCCWACDRAYRQMVGIPVRSPAPAPRQGGQR